jgi:hypothetical protein
MSGGQSKDIQNFFVELIKVGKKKIFTRGFSEKDS